MPQIFVPTSGHENSHGSATLDPRRDLPSQLTSRGDSHAFRGSLQSVLDGSRLGQSRDLVLPEAPGLGTSRRTRSDQQVFPAALIKEVFQVKLPLDQAVI